MAVGEGVDVGLTEVKEGERVGGIQLGSVPQIESTADTTYEREDGDYRSPELSQSREELHQDIIPFGGRTRTSVRMPMSVLGLQGSGLPLTTILIQEWVGTSSISDPDTLTHAWTWRAGL